MPRQARLDAPGTLHHVMLRGIERRAIVTDDADRHEFVSRLGASAMQSRTSCTRLWLGLVDQSRPPAATQRSRWVTPVDAPLSDRVCPSLQPAPPASRSPVSESLQVHCVRGEPLFCGVNPLHPSQSFACKAGQDFKRIGALSLERAWSTVGGASGELAGTGVGAAMVRQNGR